MDLWWNSCEPYKLERNPYGRHCDWYRTYIDTRWREFDEGNKTRLNLVAYRYINAVYRKIKVCMRVVVLDKHDLFAFAFILHKKLKEKNDDDDGKKRRNISSTILIFYC